jgi:hypothetical protein
VWKNLKYPKKNSMNAIEMSGTWNLETDVEELIGKN